MKLVGLVCAIVATNLSLVEGFRFIKNHAARARAIPYEESTHFRRSKHGNVRLPWSLNYVQSGYVSKVKNSGVCKSDWVVAATGVLEGAYAKATGRRGERIQQFSDQLILSCATRLKDEGWKSRGCSGGDPVEALEYIQLLGWNCFSRTVGFQSFNSQTVNCPLRQYVRPLTNMTLKEYCSEFKFKKDMAMGGTRFNNLSIYKGPGLVNSTRLKQMLVVLGPVAVAIDGSRLFYYDPSKGHFSDCSSSEDALSYVLLLVGYGTDSFGDYWLLKASYGETFGIDGYVKLPRGTDRNGNDLNSCGLLHHPFGMSVDAYTES
uniref:Peptidase C1A papain C-terminal domain-containing protein n=1 Tax=Mucochytrium quahogii TaxID=96639 RepID=A0A7S2SPJ4_9STRA|mmetsp:Transcript_9055/g.19528  ORF Transcript_9055/g.19528 Transcript_9055/m.19528 type:complete len:319 (+) Transcript_9055:372-1328(+)